MKKIKVYRTLTIGDKTTESIREIDERPNKSWKDELAGHEKRIKADKDKGD